MAVNKPFRMIPMGCFEDLLSLCNDALGQAVMNDLRCKQSDTGMTMLAVVPWEKVPAENSCIFNGAKTLGNSVC